MQCESEIENAELLDAVRYIIQRETNEADRSQRMIPQEDLMENPTAAETVYIPNHTVLLLSLPRGHSFTGYQGNSMNQNSSHLSAC